MKRFRAAVFLMFGLALPGAAAFGQSTPWEPIEVGLGHLAEGDARAAEAAFRQARRADDSGLAELLQDLAGAYAAFEPSDGEWQGSARALAAHVRLDVANQLFHRQPIPPAVLGEALARVRKDLQRAPGVPTKGAAPSLLRPLLCHLRLLARDAATDGEPVLEPSGTSDDMGSLVPPRPAFNPTPPVPDGAREAKTRGTVILSVVVDSEGCPRSETLQKTLPKGLGDQTVATVRWWAWEPASYAGSAVGWKLSVTVNYVIF